MNPTRAGNARQAPGAILSEKSENREEHGKWENGDGKMESK
jgi:hypothetical protein